MSISKQKGPPTEHEVAAIGTYNVELIEKAQRVIDEEQGRQPGLRKMSVLEKNRAALRFLKMKERPEDYILHNRYLDRGPLPKIGASEYTGTPSKPTRESKARNQERDTSKDARSRAASLLSKRTMRKSMSLNDVGPMFPIASDSENAQSPSNRSPAHSG